jgi:hypothetical protein
MPGLGKKTFTAGDVLIAGDVNGYLMDQTVMNFATVAARSSAIPVPSTGMVSYVGDTGTDTATNATIANVPQIQAYTGAAWQNVDGMTLVAKATIGTTVSSVTMTNVFSADYENYKILISGGSASTSGQLFFKLNGITSSDYYSTVIFNAFGSSSPAAQSLNANYWNWFGTYNTVSINCNSELNSPFLSELKIFSAPFVLMNSVGGVGGTTTGFINSTSSATGFTIETSAGTLTGGTIYVYGYGAS